MLINFSGRNFQSGRGQSVAVDYLYTYFVIKSEPLNINGWSIKLKYMPTDVCAKCESVCGWLDVYNYGEGKAPAGREL